MTFTGVAWAPGISRHCLAPSPVSGPRSADRAKTRARKHLHLFGRAPSATARAPFSHQRALFRDGYITIRYRHPG